MKTINTTRRTFVGGATTLTLGAMLAACGGNNTAETTDATTEEATTEATEETTETAAAGEGTYAIHVQGYDWGAGVDKVILTLPEAIDAISADDIAVSETKQVTDWTAEDFPVIESTLERKVDKAYLCDATGAETTGSSANVALELYCSPDEGSPFLYTMATGFNTWCDPYYLTFTPAEGSALAGITFAQDPTATETSADAFALDSFTASDGTAYNYATFTPEADSTKLVVWLHGAGEGGIEKTDPKVTLLANKVVALSEDAFQQTVGGAHVLVPQSPTMWMDIDGTSTYIDAENSTEVRSVYTESLEELIDSYAEKIGAEKIFVCGC